MAIYLNFMSLQVKFESGAKQFLENMGTRFGTVDSVSLLNQNNNCVIVKSYSR